MHKAVEVSSVHESANDTNLLVDKSLKKINKHINRDLQLTVDWVRANKTSLNTSKTETVKPRNKIITKHLNCHISSEKNKLSSQVRYLGVTLQDDLHWNISFTCLIKKSKHRLLPKIRVYVPKRLVRNIYYSIFNSHLIYACEIW